MQDHTPDAVRAADQFPTDATGLPEAGRPALLELSDGDDLNLHVGPVAMQLADTRVRMLGYNGSIPGPMLKVRQGTEIVVTLPAQVAGVAEVPDASPRARKPAGGKAPSRILVVDDLAASAETLMTLLEMEGFEVKIASEGMAALKIAEGFRPDVVLLDIGLPGMNGFEVAHRLRTLPESRDALLIALTGYGEAESRMRSAQAGFDFHMVKPADVNLLLSMLANPQEARRAKTARVA